MDINEISGFLKKFKSNSMARILGNTNLRFFQADKNEMHLPYRSNLREKKFKKVYPFNIITDMIPEVAFKENKYCDWKFGFKLKINNSYKTFFAETQEEQAKWIKFFKEVLWHEPLKDNKNENSIKDISQNITLNNTFVKQSFIKDDSLIESKKDYEYNKKKLEEIKKKLKNQNMNTIYKIEDETLQIGFVQNESNKYNEKKNNPCENIKNISVKNIKNLDNSENVIDASQEKSLNFNDDHRIGKDLIYKNIPKEGLFKNLKQKYCFSNSNMVRNSLIANNNIPLDKLTKEEDENLSQEKIKLKQQKERSKNYTDKLRSLSLFNINQIKATTHKLFENKILSQVPKQIENKEVAQENQKMPINIEQSKLKQETEEINFKEINYKEISIIREVISEKEIQRDNPRNDIINHPIKLKEISEILKDVNISESKQKLVSEKFSEHKMELQNKKEHLNNSIIFDEKNIYCSNLPSTLEDKSDQESHLKNDINENREIERCNFIQEIEDFREIKAYRENNEINDNKCIKEILEVERNDDYQEINSNSDNNKIRLSNEQIQVNKNYRRGNYNYNELNNQNKNIYEIFESKTDNDIRELKISNENKESKGKSDFEKIKVNYENKSNK